MRKINRAPETRSSGDLYVSSSAEERRRMTRYTDGRRVSRKNRFNHKILLFDLLFLLIIGGVIVPFLINRNMRDAIGPLSFKMELRRQDQGEDLFVSLLIRRDSQKEEPSREPLELVLKVGDLPPVTFSELPPPPGEERALRYRAAVRGGAVPVVWEIAWGEETRRLNGKL